MIKKIKNTITLNSVLLSIYFILVCGSYLYRKISDSKIVVAFLIVGFACSCMCFSLILNILNRLELITTKKNKNLPVFVITSFFCIIISLIWFIGYYPGGFSNDSMGQLAQANTGKYGDWHPVWHTLVFFTLPLKLTGNIGGIVLFQLICFALSIGYLSTIMNKYFGIKCMVLCDCYIMLNPYTIRILMYPWKDVAFAIAGLVCTICAADIYFSKGEWCNKLYKIAFLGFIMASCTLFRHNAILFTAPLIIALFFYMKKRNWFQLLSVVVITLVIIKGPIYSILNVVKPGNRVVETTGTPLTIIGNVAKEEPEKMDDELKNFVTSIAPIEQWKNSYRTGDFNSIKFSKTRIDLNIVEEYGFYEMLRLSAKCFVLAPESSLRGFIELSDLVYGFTTGNEGDFAVSIADNSITYNGNEKIKNVLDSYYLFFSKSILRIFKTLGIAIFAMLLAILSKISFKKKNDWKKILLCLPIFIYDFGTMLLLTGPDSRFFYITFLVTPLIIMLALYERENDA